MKEYLYLAAGAVFLTVFVGFIVPEGKMKKSIGFVMRIACIFVLITPVKQMFRLTDADTGSMIDYEAICAVYSETQSERLENMIYEEFSVECECRVDFVYEDGEIRENGVEVLTDIVDVQIKNSIYEYLESLGYIDINVNEKTS